MDLNKFLTFTYENHKNDKLSSLAKRYAKEARKSSLNEFVENYTRLYGETILEVIKKFSFSKNEFLVYCGARHYLMTNEAIYFLNQNSNTDTKIFLNEIENYRQDNFLTTMTYITLKSGDTIKIPGKFSSPPEKIIKFFLKNVQKRPILSKKAYNNRLNWIHLILSIIAFLSSLVTLYYVFKIYPSEFVIIFSGVFTVGIAIVKILNGSVFIIIFVATLGSLRSLTASGYIINLYGVILVVSISLMSYYIFCYLFFSLFSGKSKGLQITSHESGMNAKKAELTPTDEGPKLNCPQCNFHLGIGDIYCINCGKHIHQQCSKCKNVISMDAQFCMNCGNKQV